MTEEPRLHTALQRLMDLLDDEVPKMLVRTSFSQLDASVVEAAESSLSQPKSTELEDARSKAREQVEQALYNWLETTNDWHRSN